jgi:hypothetical protein
MRRSDNSIHDKVSQKQGHNVIGLLTDGETCGFTLREVRQVHPGS